LTAFAPSKEARARMEALGRDHPEQRAWLALLDEALSAAADPAWGEGLGEWKPVAIESAPLCAGASLRADARRAEALFAALFERARVASPAPRAPLAIALLEASINQDSSRFEEAASALSVNAEALAPIAALAAMPILHACHRLAAGRADPAWARGYCPICGALPALAELRGLTRARRLRCGRCGADWAFPPLACVYCGVTDHEELGSLVPERGGESRKADICRACRGYLKSISTLSPLPADRIALEDLATVELDLAALENGYERPESPGAALDARLIAEEAAAERSGGELP
jgi:FdhE protein